MRNTMNGKFTVKQVIIIRRDLEMGTGKLVSQACHACLRACEEAKKLNLRIWKLWHEEGEKKVILKTKSLRELLDLLQKAKRLGFPCSLVVDRGLTQLSADTITALGIGPADADEIDKISGHLKLLWFFSNQIGNDFNWLFARFSFWSNVRFPIEFGNDSNRLPNRYNSWSDISSPIKSGSSVNWFIENSRILIDLKFLIESGNDFNWLCDKFI